MKITITVEMDEKSIAQRGVVKSAILQEVKNIKEAALLLFNFSDLARHSSYNRKALYTTYWGSQILSGLSL